VRLLPTASLLLACGPLAAAPGLEPGDEEARSALAGLRAAAAQTSGEAASGPGTDH
jgi:hypothetical protein